MLIGAAARLDVPLDVVIAVTNGWEDQPDVIRKMMAEAGVEDRLRTNVEYASVQQMMRSTGAMVYSIRPGQPIGQPRTIIEAALAATPLVIPEASALRDLIGDCAHYYERGDGDSLQRAMAEALDRPRPLDERIELADRIRREHSGQDRFAEWTQALTLALVDWQARHQHDDAWVRGQWWMRS